MPAYTKNTPMQQFTIQNLTAKTQAKWSKGLMLRFQCFVRVFLWYTFIKQISKAISTKIINPTKKALWLYNSKQETLCMRGAYQN